MFAESFLDTRSSEACRPPRRPPSGPSTSSDEPSRPDTVVESLALVGLEPRLVRVHARVEPGPGALVFLGLSELRAREVRVRVHAALQSLGQGLSVGHITVRLETGSFDPQGLLPSSVSDAAVAIAVYAAACRLDVTRLRGTAIVGELSLDGSVRSVRGALPMVRGAAALGVPRVIVPTRNGAEAALSTGTRIELIGHLRDLIGHLKDGAPLQVASKVSSAAVAAVPDLAEIRGMHGGRRALEIAAAGGHGLLLTGPLSSGKIALARRLPGILPEPSAEEALDMTAIQSVAGSTNRGPDSAPPVPSVRRIPV